MKILKESKESLPITFLTNFISESWSKVGELKDQKTALKDNFKGTKKVEDLLQDLIDAYLVCIGQLEQHLEAKDYLDTDLSELPLEENFHQDIGLEEGVSYRGLAYYEYPEGSGCHIRETPTSFVALDEHGTTLGEHKTQIATEAIIDEYLKHNLKENLPEPQDLTDDEYVERIKQLKQLYDIEPSDLTPEELKELRDAGALEEDCNPEVNEQFEYFVEDFPEPIKDLKLD